MITIAGIKVNMFSIEGAFVSHYLMISDLLYFSSVFTFVFVLILKTNLHTHIFVCKSIDFKKIEYIKLIYSSRDLYTKI